MELEINFKCDECGDLLEEIPPRYGRKNIGEVLLAPCPSCLKDIRKEGYDEGYEVGKGEGYESGLVEGEKAATDDIRKVMQVAMEVTEESAA